MGPVPMILGSTPPWPQETTLNRGFRPYFFTASSEAMRMAAAASFRPEALPAVTRCTPVFSGVGVMWEASKVISTLSMGPSAEVGKAPFSLAIFSRSVSLGCSSTLNSTISFFFFTGTGTISSSKRPDLTAARAFCWEL